MSFSSKLRSIVGIIVLIGFVVTLVGLIVMWCQSANALGGSFTMMVKLHIIGVLLAVLLNLGLYFLDCAHFAVPSFAIYTFCGPFLMMCFRRHDWNPNDYPLAFFIGSIIAFVGFFMTCFAIIPYTAAIIPSTTRLARPSFVISVIVLALTLLGGIWFWVESVFGLEPMFWGVYFFFADIWHLDFLVDHYCLPIGAALWALWNRVALMNGGWTLALALPFTQRGSAADLNTPAIITYVGLCIGLFWMLMCCLSPALRDVSFNNLRTVTIAPARRVSPSNA